MAPIVAEAYSVSLTAARLAGHQWPTAADVTATLRRWSCHGTIETTRHECARLLLTLADSEYTPPSRARRG